jgi:hypothetical protein
VFQRRRKIKNKRGITWLYIGYTAHNVESFAFVRLLWKFVDTKNRYMTEKVTLYNGNFTTVLQDSQAPALKLCI